ncbi:hypothetical protein PT974_09823 [Cladobotryum mycophilum]|uniref:CBM-cenC domain-containing protein n=1 Tax=Cladobotryum mycophilum TaxID=491253 RepID=A0ABR0SH88_9HYPO
MLNKSIISALALVGAASASPLERVERDVCNHDNLLRCFIDQRYSTSASAYCSGLTPYTKTVATVTPTITKTILKTATANAVTNTITSTTTVYTATVPSATATITQGSTSPLKGRLVVGGGPPVIHAQPPKCMTSGVNYPASRVTSACACINVPAKTVSVTYTEPCTKSKTVTSTVSITPTVTATVWQTVSTVTTSGIATVTVTPPPPPPPPAASNLITNSGFETGALTPWQTIISAPSAWAASVVSTDTSPSGPGHVLQLSNSASGSNAFIASPMFGVNAVSTYTLSFSIKNPVDISAWQSLVTVQVNCGSITVASPTLVNQGVAVDNEYYKFTSQFTTPAATTPLIANQLKSCQLQILFKGGLQTPNTWFFDDASISPA